MVAIAVGRLAKKHYHGYLHGFLAIFLPFDAKKCKISVFFIADTAKKGKKKGIATA
jgi:hypothetical protein